MFLATFCPCGTWYLFMLVGMATFLLDRSHPVSNLAVDRGKVRVKKLSEIDDVEGFLKDEDTYYHAMNTQQHNG